MRSTRAVVSVAIILSLLLSISQLYYYNLSNDDINININDDVNNDAPPATATTNCHYHHHDNPQTLFYRLKPIVFQQTLVKLQTIFPFLPLAKLREDLDEIQQLWHPFRVKRSTVNPIPTSSRTKLMDIIHRRQQQQQQQQQNNANTASNSTSNNPPLHIMIFGGSIVLGNGAGVGFHGKKGLSGGDSNVRWSTQLEDLLNLWYGIGSIKITNMANGGMTTGISTIPLEYGIYPDNNIPPDLVIAAFGYNDMNLLLAQHQNSVFRSGTTTNDSEKYNFLLKDTQRFVRAAAGACIPVILVDDSYLIPRATIRFNLLHSHHIAEIANWYDIGAISWTRAFMGLSYSDRKLHNISQSGTDDIDYWPLWGGNLRTSHPNIMYHVGMAWLLFYQIVLQLSESAASSSLLLLDPRCNNGNGNDAISTTTMEKLDPRNIPPLDQNTRIQSLAPIWKNNTTVNMKKCSSSSSSSRTTKNTCSYLWIANRATNIQTKQDVKRIIDTVLIFNKGWMEEGNPIRKPRPGWVALKKKAMFTIRINATAANISKVTLLYLKSYGPKWQDSKLRVTLRIRRNESYGITKKVKRDLVGYHDSNTSINYEAIIPIEARIGDYVLANFQVTSGTTFRINGMLFC